MKKKTLIILGIETSCDETAASLLKIVNCKLKIVSNIVSSQVKIHAQYGGIVPEVAARKHVENIIGVLETALNFKCQNPNFKQISKPKFQKLLNEIDVIAVTSGPGLITSLLVGVEAAKTLAFLANKPLIPVNHLLGHIYSNFINIRNWELEIRNLFPAIGLIVSGGHTELVLMCDFENFQKIGQTLDDAAGECFDKVAKVLGLAYPGGPAISEQAQKWKFEIQNSTSAHFRWAGSPSPYSRAVAKFEIKLPRPMINSGDFNFSFSGLKTAVLHKVQKMSKQEIKKKLPEICHETQQAIIDVLIAKTIKAAKKYQAKSIILGGGVVANEELRKQFVSKVYSLSSRVKFFAPVKNLCTDNAVMIAAAGYFKLKKMPKSQWFKKFNWQKIEVDPNLEI